jgi:lactoylglutathione lyase
MARITGLGGVFLKVDGDARALIVWYHDVLGIEAGRYGLSLPGASVPTLATLNEHPDGAVLNFTVDDLPAYLSALRERGVRVVQEVADYDYGRFAQIADPLGGVIELWEPNLDAYRAMAAAEVAAYEAERTGHLNMDGQGH